MAGPLELHGHGGRALVPEASQHRAELGPRRALDETGGSIRPRTAPDTDPVEFERACHDEAWGCAYSRVWRAYLDVIREAA